MTTPVEREHSTLGPLEERGGHLFQRIGMVVRDLGLIRSAPEPWLRPVAGDSGRQPPYGRRTTTER